MAQEKLCILLFQPFTSTVYLLFCFLLSRELRGLASARALFFQQGGWSWDHHHVLTEVNVALKSQGIESSIKLFKPIFKPSGAQRILC